MKSSGRQSDEVQKRGKGGQREEEGDNWRHFKSEKDIEAPAPLLPLRIETSGEHNGGYIFLTFEDGEREGQWLQMEAFGSFGTSQGRRLAGRRTEEERIGKSNYFPAKVKVLVVCDLFLLITYL